MRIDWGTVLSTLITSSVLIGAVVWIARMLFAHLLSKDVERFKAKIELASIEHQIRFSRLHERQASVLAELFEKLLPAKWCFISLHKSAANEFTDENRRLALKILASCIDGYQYAQRHALYLDDALLKAIETTNLQVMKRAGFYTGMEDILGSFENVPEERRRLLAETLVRGWRDLEDDITPLLDALRSEFQKRLGVASPRMED